MCEQYEQSDFNISPQDSTKHKKFLRGLSISFAVLAGFIMAHLANGTLVNPVETPPEDSLWNQVVQVLPFSKDKPAFSAEYTLPPKDDNRMDILILGIRGDNDPNGGNLTDTLMLLSYDRTTHKAGLVSIPRDMYVTVLPGVEDKINTAYLRLGVNGVKRLFSRITGVEVDHAVVFDFEAFKDIVDQLDGIDVHLDQPFTETQQWGYTFSLPAGDNHLNGEEALYFARSRFSSNDFDRAARQQKIILAVKQKAQALNVWSDPIQVLGIFNTIRNHIKTDIDVLEVKRLVTMGQNLSNNATIKHQVLSTDNLLYNTTINGAYVLLPQGNNLTAIKLLFKNIIK